MPPEPAAGSATFARLDSSSRMSCVLRAMRRAKRSGRPMRRGERQHRDRVGAAEPGREHRDGRAQHVHVRIAPRHHAPRGFGGDESRRGRQARRPVRRAPTVFAARGTSRWSGTDRHRRRGGNRSCAAPHRARCRALPARADRSTAQREREGKLLRLRAAGIVDDAPVRDRERPAETLVGELSRPARRNRAQARSTAAPCCRSRRCDRAD